MSMNWIAIISLGVSGVVVISLVAILGGFLQVRRERLLAHEERMRALELGRAMPDDAATARIKAAFGIPASGEELDSPALARKCYSTSLWVAFWGFMAAASHGGVGISTGVALAIAASTGAIGVTGMICGTILAMRSPATARRMTASIKPQSEEDAYDVVSCRG